MNAHYLHWPLLVMVILNNFVHHWSMASTENTNLLSGIDSDHSISILTYNLWGLPVQLKDHHQEFRFKQIAKQLKESSYEVICLQETFSLKLRRYLASNLDDQWFNAQDGECNRKILGWIPIDCYGGLQTWSKYPIIQEEFYPFFITESYSRIEKWAKKGVLFTTVLRNGTPINIVNTHLYAGNSRKARKIRMQQVQQICTYLDSKPNFHLYETIFCGDFNIDSAKKNIGYPDLLEDFIIKELGFKDATFSKDFYTINPSENKYTPKNRPCQRLDYIFYKSSQNQKNRKMVSAQTDIQFRGQQALSDHLALNGTIKIKD